jgi:hypothetical protein
VGAGKGGRRNFSPDSGITIREAVEWSSIEVYHAGNGLYRHFMLFYRKHLSLQPLCFKDKPYRRTAAIWEGFSLALP